MNNIANQVQRLHTIFCEATGTSYTLHYERQRAWVAWMHRGWGEADIKLVVRYLKKAIRENRRNQGALKFRNLISHDPDILDNFEEDLNEARRVLNVRPPRPAFIEVEQRHGDIRQLVEVHAPEEMVDCREVFADIRRSLENRRGPLKDAAQTSKTSAPPP